MHDYNFTGGILNGSRAIQWLNFDSEVATYYYTKDDNGCLKNFRTALKGKVVARTYKSFLAHSNLDVQGLRSSQNTQFWKAIGFDN